MADALKAEGNKAFSAKDYATAMYVPFSPSGFCLLQQLQPLTGGKATNSRRLLPSNPRITFCIPTVQQSTLLCQITSRLLMMLTRLPKSSLTGPKAGAVKEPLHADRAICVRLE
jgi:hypothetical protein